jgi:hypothetical protein
MDALSPMTEEWPRSAGEAPENPHFLSVQWSPPSRRRTPQSPLKLPPRSPGQDPLRLPSLRYHGRDLLAETHHVPPHTAEAFTQRCTYVRLRCCMQASLAWRGVLPLSVACAPPVDEASLWQDPRHVHEGPRPPLHRVAHIPV